MVWITWVTIWFNWIHNEHNGIDIIYYINKILMPILFLAGTSHEGARCATIA